MQLVAEVNMLCTIRINFMLLLDNMITLLFFPQHVGDLGNITAAENGRARFRIVDNRVKVGVD